jgi:hypothetical protein
MRFGLFAALVTVGLATGNAAYAASYQDYEVVYFRERALLTQVGDFHKPCGTGAAKLTGFRTRYFVKSTARCTGGAHPPPSSAVSCHFTQSGCTDALASAFPIHNFRTIRHARSVHRRVMARGVNP